ncbi:MAG: sulfatase-like hydrolase/transferase [Muribaculaceae bacterium]
MKKINWPTVMAWALPLTLIVPNVWLNITEHYTLLSCLNNIVTPVGIYLLIASCCTKIGRTALLCIPLMIYAAFQIVLMFLYGENIIAIDMFLNVATTNFGEATRLLGALPLAILTVCAIYLPVIIGGIVLCKRKMHLERATMLRIRHLGAPILIVGVMLCAACELTDAHYHVERQLFPFNVMYNTGKAVQRGVATSHFKETSADFRFNSVDTHPTDRREVYVLIIGETSRADNWQLMGYDRPTNPRLSQRDNIIVYPKAVTQSNTTHKSVPLILSSAIVENYDTAIYTHKGVLSAFNEAGYTTAFISNQARNHSFIDHLGEEAQHVTFITADGSEHLDSELLPVLQQRLDQAEGKLFVVLHTYGNHFCYRDRYPRDHAFFTPDHNIDAERYNRPDLINAYDNSIRETDLMLDSVISMLERCQCPAAVLFLSDHGEDIFDDDRGRFLHASPVPTYYQIHVPMLMWFSPQYVAAYPEQVAAANAHTRCDVASNDAALPTMLSLAGIRCDSVDYTCSLASPSYYERPRIYLNDYNEAIPLSESGLRECDLQQLTNHHISNF